jgi:hypothetical protein
MTYKQKLKAIDKAIAAMKRELERNPPKKVTLPKRLRNPNEIAHDEFCEDMKAIGEATGTPWGGHFGEEV